MHEKPYVSIVLPVYKQFDHIEEIVTTYVATLDHLKHSFEMILVVNGTRNGSLRVYQDLAETHPSIRTIYSEKAGWGRAVRMGIGTAQGQVICYTNSARTTPYTLISLLLLAIANPEYILKANRRLRYPIIRRIGSVLYNVQCRYLFDLAVWDINGTPKIFRRDLFESLALKENGDLFDLEFMITCKRQGLRILEVPIVSSERHGGRSTTNVFSACKMYQGAFRMWHNMKKIINTHSKAEMS
jgi:undecaprenyl-phosphate 4-deoxy-4-formamido-L-arabinose transferase